MSSRGQRYYRFANEASPQVFRPMQKLLFASCTFCYFVAGERDAADRTALQTNSSIPDVTDLEDASEFQNFDFEQDSQHDDHGEFDQFEAAEAERREEEEAIAAQEAAEAEVRHQEEERRKEEEAIAARAAQDAQAAEAEVRHQEEERRKEEEAIAARAAQDAQANPRATIGLDTSGDGRANMYVNGADRNRDGIPDAVERKVPASGYGYGYQDGDTKYEETMQEANSLKHRMHKASDYLGSAMMQVDSLMRYATNYKRDHQEFAAKLKKFKKGVTEFRKHAADRAQEHAADLEEEITEGAKYANLDEVAD